MDTQTPETAEKQTNTQTPQTANKQTETVTPKISNYFTQTQTDTKTYDNETVENLINLLKKKEQEIVQLRKNLDECNTLQWLELRLKQCCLNEKQSAFFATQLRLLSKKPKGRRWSDFDISLALSIFHASHKAYRLLCQVFILPSVSTLRKSVRDIKIYPGFSQSVIDILGDKIKLLGHGSELCSLVIDEMTIQPNLSYNKETDSLEGYEDFGSLGKTVKVADHVLVFLLRGLKDNWKQPIGYFLSDGPMTADIMKPLVLECIAKCSKKELMIKCLVSDQGSNNRKLFKDLGVTTSKPYFSPPDSSDKIFTFYDAPHLLKSIRNNFIKTGYICNSKHIKWEYIRLFYNEEKDQAFRLAPKLTDRHFLLSRQGKMNVRLAAQIFSNSVGAGIRYKGKVNNDENAPFVADFIQNFDKLFNTFNSRHFDSTQPFGHPFSEASGHITFLNDTFNWL